MELLCLKIQFRLEVVVETGTPSDYQIHVRPYGPTQPSSSKSGRLEGCRALPCGFAWDINFSQVQNRGTKESSKAHGFLGRWTSRR